MNAAKLFACCTKKLSAALSVSAFGSPASAVSVIPVAPVMAAVTATYGANARPNDTILRVAALTPALASATVISSVVASAPFAPMNLGVPPGAGDKIATMRTWRSAADGDHTSERVAAATKQISNKQHRRGAI